MKDKESSYEQEILSSSPFKSNIRSGPPSLPFIKDSTDITPKMSSLPPIVTRKAPSYPPNKRVAPFLSIEHLDKNRQEDSLSFFGRKEIDKTLNDLTPINDVKKPTVRRRIQVAIPPPP